MTLFKTWLESEESLNVLSEKQLQIFLDGINSNDVAIRCSNVFCLHFGAAAGVSRSYLSFSYIKPEKTVSYAWIIMEMSNFR